MASRKYGYVLTEIAEADIDETFEYIAEELSNPDAVAGFADALEKKTDEICKTPNSGRLVENEHLKRNDVRRFLVDNYICYYIVDDKESIIFSGIPNYIAIIFQFNALSHKFAVFIKVRKAQNVEAV